ncbi:type ISP restriction/modification enzyme [Aquisediminimonas sediminicola]|uniref:type ISP restriction/modification enzyme n=1 Tax=Alteraquisediminimonas sediminicola TaxID=2676787 RepID=UPI001C8D7452|nr:type ISP restriction/modification enzyme [Aquisediminimonas sediminicola]
MAVDIQGYVNEIRALYASGQTTEHSFRPALAKLFTSIDSALTVINEPKHITDVGAPDFVFQRGDVAIGWCEAKDIGKDVRKFAANDYSKGQKDRYRKGLPNLIYTNGLDFEFIREGDVVDFISIADLIPTLPARTGNFPLLENRLRDFVHVTPLSITSSKRLAEMMAGKAAIIKDIMGRALVADMKAKDATGTATDLIGQYEAFKASLIHDISAEEFADIYAETIAYGLFAARLHDETPESFTRAEALDLLPKTNPFLRELFIYIAGPNLDERLRRVIDELCNVFCATDMDKVLRNFGKITARQDPFLHFYENFLAEYNPAKRKARGVWYTPEPVVNFIVRAVDEVLKTEFGLPDGLADTSKITIDWDTGQNDPRTGKPAHIKKEVHRVQILDPATGTGTFLAEVVKLVSERIKDVAPGQLSAYIERDLIPRLHGFELLMASYAMCHMKLDMILTRLGYKPSANPPRLGVYLTNSLEEGERVEQTLFGLSRAIANEAKAASDIKRQTPIMCVIGNPPYSGHSSNKGAWIEKLMGDYKVSPELKRPAQAKWLSDDYVKFLRFAEHMIEQNGEGVLGFITNHGYLDNPTFMDMRHHLRQTFDRIYVLDLHGNSKKKEVCPDGSPDKNVFDIQQGVAIIVAVKRRQGAGTKPLAQVLHGELWGDRDSKYQQLCDGTTDALMLDDVSPEATPWRFKPTDRALEAIYQAGFSVADLFSPNGRPAPGIVTTHDEFAISWSAAEAVDKVERLLATADESEARQLFRLCSQNQWNYAAAKVALADGTWRQAITPIAYRPFDTRYTVYNSHVAVHRRDRVMQHLFNHNNINLMLTGQTKDEVGGLVSNNIAGHKAFSGFDITYNLPLYLYPEESTLDQTIRVNFDPKLYTQIRKAAGLFASPAPDGTNTFREATGDTRPDEVQVFDYIYGVLHCPAYRATYADFLKSNFPRIPFPASPESFRVISEAGEALRRLHLMEDAAIGETPYIFHGDGNSVLDKPRYENGQVWVNADQYFDGVPAIAWDFHIGGYQPAQKWLKDRKGHELSWDDIRHYQKIIKILSETDRIMKEINLPLD